MTSDEEIQAAKQSTAKALGEEIDSLDYITAELLAVEVTSDEPPYESDDQEGVVPNRITYISHVVQGFDGVRTNYTFYANCTYGARYLIWTDSVDRVIRDGSCRVPNGNYVPRFKMWWRA